MEEVWVDVPGYVGKYQVSNLGKVKSLERYRTNKSGTMTPVKERILSPVNNKGYHTVTLYKGGKYKRYKVHQIVAMGFLGHKPNGNKLVVNHINFEKTDNRLSNLELVTNRENCNRKHLPSSSKYTGVCWNKDMKKWLSSIQIGGETLFLGYYESEYDAHLTYQRTLNSITT